MYIPRYKAGKDHHTRISRYPIDDWWLKEDIDNGGNNKAYKERIEQTAHTRKVEACDIAHKAHSEESARRNKECGGYGLASVDALILSALSVYRLWLCYRKGI